MKLKAGALYFAIVIAFFIAIISAAILMLAAHYRNTYLKEIRFARLLNNLNAGVDYALMVPFKNEATTNIDLYADQSDSLIIARKHWGLFDLAIIKTFILSDTLKRAMLIGTTTDSTAIYMADEDRPLLLGGKAKLTGNVYLPKSGLKKSYVDGKPYAYEKMVYEGRILHSTRKLESVDQEILTLLQKRLAQSERQLPMLSEAKINHSFFEETLEFALAPKAQLKDVELKGNIVLYADSAITIAASSKLDGVQLYAPFIKIEEGFKGNCQLFATDSIMIGKRSKLSYPSVAAVIKTADAKGLAQLSLAEGVDFEGVLLTYEAKRSPLQTLISLGANSKVKGEIYSVGLLQLTKGVVVEGKVSCHRFLMNFSGAIYENFLIDVDLNRKSRSTYYLSSRFFKSTTQNKVLKWLAQ